MTPFSFDVLELMEELACRLDEPTELLSEGVEDLPQEIVEDRIARAERRVRIAREGNLPSLSYWEERLAALNYGMMGLLERDLKVGQGYDIGTERTWSKGTFVKTNKGWVRKSSGKAKSSTSPEAPKSPAKAPSKASGPAKPAEAPAPKAPPADAPKGKEAPPEPPPTGVEKAKLKAAKGDSFNGLVKDLRKAFAGAVLSKLGDLAASGLGKFLPKDAADEIGHRAAQMLGKGLGKLFGSGKNEPEMPEPKATEPEEPKAEEPKQDKPKAKKKKLPKSRSTRTQVSKAVDKLRKSVGLPDHMLEKPKPVRAKTKEQKARANAELEAFFKSKKKKR